MLKSLSKDRACEVANIEKECFGAEGWSIESVLSSLEKPYCTFEVLEIDGVIVGYYSFYNLGGEAYINNIAVKPEYQGKGYGKLLLNRLVEKAKEGASAITLEVRKSNLRAQNLYESAGFKNKGIRPKFYNNTEDAVIYWYKMED